MIIELEYKCPSWNKYERLHFQTRNKLNKEIYELVYYTIKKRKLIERFDKCEIIFEINYKGSRRHDTDNCCLKPFIDGIVKTGIIKDDSTEIIKMITIKCNTKAKSDYILIKINKYNGY